MTKRSSWPLAVAVVLSCASLSLISAQERMWTAGHHNVTLGPGEDVAEFTLIQTLDHAMPIYQTFLYQSVEGYQLIVRNKIFSAAGDSILEFRQPNGSEFLTSSVSLTAQIVLTINGQSISFPDGTNSFPAATVAAAKTLLNDNTSQGFRVELRNLAMVGSYDSIALHAPAFILRELFFDDIASKVAVGDITKIPLQLIENFDPIQNPPGAFEIPFGSYYSIEQW